MKLYGKFIISLKLKEALFILNIKNYQNTYEKFKNNFQKCNEVNLVIDDELKIILKTMFKTDHQKLPIYNNTKYKIDKYSKKDLDRIKVKHPNGYNIDSIYKENPKIVEKDIKTLNGLTRFRK